MDSIYPKVFNKSFELSKEDTWINRIKKEVNLKESSTLEEFLVRIEDNSTVNDLWKKLSHPALQNTKVSSTTILKFYNLRPSTDLEITIKNNLLEDEVMEKLERFQRLSEELGYDVTKKSKAA